MTEGWSSMETVYQDANTCFKAGHEVRLASWDGIQSWAGTQSCLSRSWEDLETEMAKKKGCFIVRKEFIELIKSHVIFRQRLTDLELKVFQYNIGGQAIYYPDIIDDGHPLAQIMRIPILNHHALSYSKLMEISFHMGQIQADIDRKKFPDEVASWIYDQGILNIDTIVDIPLDYQFHLLCPCS